MTDIFFWHLAASALVNYQYVDQRINVRRAQPLMHILTNGELVTRAPTRPIFHTFGLKTY